MVSSGTMRSQVSTGAQGNQEEMRQIQVASTLLLLGILILGWFLPRITFSFSLALFSSITVALVTSMMISFEAVKLVGFLGVICNGIAMLGNQGLMPARATLTSYRWWQPITSKTRFRFLCDIWLRGRASIGDMFIVSAVAYRIVELFLA